MSQPGRMGVALDYELDYGGITIGGRERGERGRARDRKIASLLCRLVAWPLRGCVALRCVASSPCRLVVLSLSIASGRAVGGMHQISRGCGGGRDDGGNNRS